MDLTTTPTPTTTPDTDNDTPPHTQQVKHFSYANGTLKKHHYPFHHHQQQQQQQHHHHHHHLLHQSPFGGFGIYRECLKNHAASLGGHALDGCGEFMASPTANPMDPASLKCAACGCHRNFHRREPDAYSPSNTMIPHFLDFRHPPGRSSPSPSPPPPPPPPQPTQSFAPHMLLALSSAAHDDQHGPNHHQVATPVTPTAIKSENLSGRKRFRTKFTQEQKEKMHSFSEKLGWKLQKCDDAMVEDFCNEIGVARGVLKVWMHNNKNTLGKKDIISNTNGTPANINDNNDDDNTNTISGGRVSFENGSSHNNNNNNEESNHNASHYHNETEVDAVHLHASTNASSSSS